MTHSQATPWSRIQLRQPWILWKPNILCHYYKWLPPIPTLSFLAQQPPVGRGLLISEVPRSHTTKHHSREWLLWTSDQLVAETSTWQHTQYSQQTKVHVPGGIRTHNLNRRAVADLSLRPRGHWDRLFLHLNKVIKSTFCPFISLTTILTLHSPLYLGLPACFSL